MKLSTYSVSELNPRSNCRSGHGPRLIGLLDDALDNVAPIFRNGGDQPVSMRIYRAMEKLHDLYPHLNGDELEALLMGVFKHERR